jgi:hypothetical protein
MSVGDIRSHLQALTEALQNHHLITEQDQVRAITERLTTAWRTSTSPQSQSAIPAAHAISDHLAAATKAITAAATLLTTYTARI